MVCYAADAVCCGSWDLQGVGRFLSESFYTRADFYNPVMMQVAGAGQSEGI